MPCLLSPLPSIQKIAQKPKWSAPHFACIPCRNELFKYWNQPKCPSCVTPIYTISHCHYFQCDSCQEVKKLSTCHSHFRDFHPKQSICLQCMTFTTTKCPLCKKQLTQTTRGKILDSKLPSQIIQNVYPQST